MTTRAPAALPTRAPSTPRPVTAATTRGTTTNNAVIGLTTSYKTLQTSEKGATPVQTVISNGLFFALFLSYHYLILLQSLRPCITTLMDMDLRLLL